ncbi:MAG: hypothetical protein ABFS37_08305 [Acidobacteriota bacterium]
MNILILTDDRLGPVMAGSALRAWELGRALQAAGHQVLIAGAAGSTAPGRGPMVGTKPGWSWADAVLSAPWNLPPQAFVRRSLLIVDGVTPLPAELAAMPQSKAVRRRTRTALARIPLVAARADALLVAGRAQMHWWSTQLEHARPEMPILDTPFGVPASPPSPERAEIPGVPAHHAVVLWWGGVWPWLDLDTLLAARARLGNAPISIVVPVAARPGSSTPAFGASDLRRAAEARGLKAPRVVGLDRWIPYAERHSVLNRTSLLAVLHRAGPETTLSFRTRALDGLWAGVPLLLSEGGEVSDLAHHHGWGGVVRPGDVNGTAAALELLLTEKEQLRCRANLERARPFWSWNQLLEPLVDALPTLRQSPRDSLGPAIIRSALVLAGLRSTAGAV